MESSNKKPNRRSSSQPRTKQVKKKFNVKKLIFGLVITAIVGMICAVALYIFVMISGNQLLEENKDKYDMPASSKIVDRNGDEITSLYRENREIVSGSEIPKMVKDAFVATEDQRFYSHQGIDFLGIGRAIVKDITHRTALQGASTITQQLAKNMFWEKAPKTFFRKATEASLAIALENKNTKDEILTMYLNRIYLGSNAYGIKAASKKYFGKSDLNDLEIWEIATLAALPKAPTTYSPLRDPDKSKERRAVILRLMTEQGYITEAQRLEAAAVDYDSKNSTADNQAYPSFTDYVLKEAEVEYGIEEGALRIGAYTIKTTMDPNAQQIMESTYAQDKFFQKPAKDGTKIQSSMVILDNKDNGIIAMIGGRDYKTKDLNRVYRAERQPGSAFKPLVAFAPALESGKYTPYSMLNDKKECIAGYCPNNYNNQYQDQVTMMEAVRVSKNIAPVSLLNDIGIKTGMDMVEKMGIPLDKTKDRNLAIALGGLTKGATPMQMAEAYAIFANGGIKNKTHSIIEITSSDGKTKEFKQESKRIVSEKTAYYMTQMLQGVVQSGTGKNANFDRPVAGKTGSTNLPWKGLEKYDRDIWFVGYTPEWSAAVWQGFDLTNKDKGHFVTVGSGSTATIFKEVMSKSLAKMPKKGFTKPGGVEELKEPAKGITDLAGSFVRETRSIKLTWSSQGDKYQYQVFRRGLLDADYKQISASATAEFNDIAIEPGNKYSYYVIGTDGTNTTDKSNAVEVEVSTDGITPTPSPTPTPDIGGGDQSPSPKPTKSPKPSVPPTNENGNGNNGNGNGNGNGNNGNGNGNGNGNNGNGNGNGNQQGHNGKEPPNKNANGDGDPNTNRQIGP
ncbi:PBP1A family penicillin-binding protein [Paenibacillus sp. N1-5-1-14]|uniref:transglycosylase domain-containing protein n=1 Tax=Paenibacillus radicibacter TaxID=2972488 RepID=UPI0021592002|nr:PBP1A family penicillin-binding protein [Paenibacillus radicibacter]MCR8641618.1 PBP1A family penicillin-binding protein [Paenibacillus radicibacter]